jgi:hypothetical protein
MMSFTVDFPPELERRLKEEASRRNLTPDEFLVQVVEEKLGAPASPTDGEMLPGGIRRRSPADLLALAERQGVKPVQRFEDLLGPRWEPGEADDVDPDAFLDTLRRWYEDERPGFPETAEE